MAMSCNSAAVNLDAFLRRRWSFRCSWHSTIKSTAEISKHVWGYWWHANTLGCAPISSCFEVFPKAAGHFCAPLESLHMLLDTLPVLCACCHRCCCWHRRWKKTTASSKPSVKIKKHGKRKRTTDTEPQFFVQAQSREIHHCQRQSHATLEDNVRCNRTRVSIVLVCSPKKSNCN